MKTEEQIKERIRKLQDGIEIMRKEHNDIGVYLNEIIIATLLDVLGVEE